MGDLNEYKNNVIKEMDNLVMDSWLGKNHDYDCFDEYQDDMETLTMDMFKGECTNDN